MIHSVSISDGIAFGNDLPIILIGGINVIESRDMMMEVAEQLIGATARHGIKHVFKASFDKANRSSIHSFRGPGLERGLTMLADVRDRFDVPILTDVHEPWQAEPVSRVADILQLPAFLARQTDLVVAIARTGAVVNIKKPQFLAPKEMSHIVEKFVEYGNDRLLLCERGISFGYNNLVVDMLGIGIMKGLAPVVFDVTHALQQPGGRARSADGRGDQTELLARCGVAAGIAALFVETHPDPGRAMCDGPSALPLDRIDGLLDTLVAVDRAVKPGAYQ